MITIYKSSAGSGKTFTLVLEYLKIVLANPSLYRNVLAVTFTNKATEEMKNRIIQVLSTLAHASAVELSANSYYQKLEEHFEGMEDLPMPHLSLQDRALLVLQKILNDYSNFSVSTIESFFQRIVRAFARELQIPLGYEVEMKQDVVLREIVNRTFMEIRGDGSELEKLFTRFAESNIEEEKSWNIDREVLDLGEQVFKEKYQQLVNDYEGTTISPKEVSELAKELQKIKYEFEGQMARFGERAEKIMHTYGLEVDDFLQKKRGPMAFLLRLKQQPPLKFDHVNPQSSSYLRKLLNGEGAWASKTAPRADQVEAAAETGLNPLLDEINGYTYKNLPAYAAALQALSKVYAFGVLSELQSKLQEYRREHGQLIISDTSFLLNKVVAEQEDSPFIYEKVGNRYDHYLLDEFQDTSDMQWRNLFPLILESVANGKKGLIVGDVKQSIYRWRNGNMRLLMRAVEDKMAAFGRPTEVKHLESNFRTARDIVDFNNGFFEEAITTLSALFKEYPEDVFERSYQKARQIPHKQHVPGFVGVQFFENNYKRPEGEDWREELMEETAQLIRKLTQEEGFDGQDITLLVRRNAEGVRIAEYLQRVQIPVSSAESLLLTSHPRVKFILALIRNLSQEQESLYRAELAFYYLAAKEGSGELHDLFFKAAKPQQDQAPEADELALFQKEKGNLRQLPIYQAVERIRQIFPFLEEPNAYVQGLQDCILEYATGQDASLSGFLSWWEDVRHKRAIASDTNKHAVKIMTIHKSKGLEFPVVILPFVNWEMSPKTGDTLWVEKSEHPPFSEFSFVPLKLGQPLTESYYQSAYAEERVLSFLDNLNLLYVAMTRPEYRLYLLAEAGPQNPKKISYKYIHHFLYDILIHKGLPEQGQLWGDASFGKEITLAEIRRIEGEDDHSGPIHESLTANPEPLDWKRAMKIRFSANRFLSTNRLDVEEKIKTGELIHDALSLVKVPEDIGPAILELSIQGVLPIHLRKKVEETLNWAVSFQEAKAWFDPRWEVKNEANILDASGKSLRPDRVMIDGTHAVVVDYKTGKDHPKHLKQVQEYMEVLQKMGYTKVEGKLFYLTLSHIVDVPAPQMEKI